MIAFQAPESSIGVLDAAAAAAVLSVASDLALVLDDAGRIVDLSASNRSLAAALGADAVAPADARAWTGQGWVELLAPSSRARGLDLLRAARAQDPPEWQALSHVARDGTDIALQYAAALLPAPDGRPARIVLYARDMRPLAQLQQRLIDVQHAGERDHMRLRQLDGRYRLLLQGSDEAVVVVNAATGRISDSNPAACALLDRLAADIAGTAAAELVHARDRAALAGCIAAARAGSQLAPVSLRLASGTVVMARGSLYRDDDAAFVLLRLAAAAAPAATAAPADTAASPALLCLALAAPDGFVVTDEAGVVRQVNASFLRMIDVADEAAALGQSLDRWLGRAGVDLDVLLTNLRQRGSVRLFATTLTTAAGLSAAVEVSAGTLAAGGYGFVVRDVDRRVAEAKTGRELPQSVDQLTELIGRVALKDLVREATDMIERLCIEAALEMTNDNRASAAELLGLSRQSLYVKLHRYGLGDLADAPG